MKKTLQLAFVCLMVNVFVSCLSTPESPAEPSVPVADASVASEPVVTAEPIVAGEPVIATEPVVTTEPVATTEPTVIAELQQDATAPGISEDTVELSEKPLITETEVIIPIAEKLLYFYPEPDPLYIAPVAPVVSATTVTPKTVTPKSVTPKNVAPKAATTAVVTPPAETATKMETTDDIPAGIWTSEAVAPATDPVQTAKRPEPSRKVQLSEGQSLEVWYPGSGWVYLGDVSAQNGLEYQTRKLDNSDTLFTFRALKQGDYVLEFTRFDVLEDSFATDTLAVSVIAPDGKKTGKVRASDYRSATKNGNTATTSGNASASTSLTAPVNVTVSDEPSLVSGSVLSNTVSPKSNAPAQNAGELLERAKKSLAAGDAPSALTALETFFTLALDSIDEGLYLKGQAYEANSTSRDIRKALDAYETLVASWPESEYWKDSDARIRYIKQYYMGR